MERIELPLAVLETAALPLYYTGIYLAPQRGIEPRTNWLTANYSTAELLGNKLAQHVGFEPTQENPRTQRLKQTTLHYILCRKIIICKTNQELVD